MFFMRAGDLKGFLRWQHEPSSYWRQSRDERGPCWVAGSHTWGPQESRVKLCSEAEEAAGLREDGLAEKRGEEAGEVGGAEVRAR